VSFAAITLCVASQRVFVVVVVYFVIDPVRKLLDTPLHSQNKTAGNAVLCNFQLEEFITLLNRESNRISYY
jgi:hypothetical protein